MIKEGFRGNSESNNKIDFKTMIMLAIATSIDALVVRNNIFILQS